MALTETSDWYLADMNETDPVTALTILVERDSLYRTDDRLNKKGVFDPNPETKQAFLHARAEEFLAAVIDFEKAQAETVGRATLRLFSQSES